MRFFFRLKSADVTVSLLLGWLLFFKYFQRVREGSSLVCFFARLFFLTQMRRLQTTKTRAKLAASDERAGSASSACFALRVCVVDLMRRSRQGIESHDVVARHGARRQRVESCVCLCWVFPAISPDERRSSGAGRGGVGAAARRQRAQRAHRSRLRVRAAERVACAANSPFFSATWN